MKCIRNVAKDEIKRVNNVKAVEMIAKGWAYCPKELWKRATRPIKSVKSVKKDTSVAPEGASAQKKSSSGKKYSRQKRS